MSGKKNNDKDSGISRSVTSHLCYILHAISQSPTRVKLNQMLIPQVGVVVVVLVVVVVVVVVSVCVPAGARACNTQTDRQTHRQTDTQTDRQTPLIRAFIIPPE
jgi:hypothetical protein